MSDDKLRASTEYQQNTERILDRTRPGYFQAESLEQVQNCKNVPNCVLQKNDELSSSTRKYCSIDFISMDVTHHDFIYMQTPHESLKTEWSHKVAFHP